MCRYKGRGRSSREANNKFGPWAGVVAHRDGATVRFDNSFDQIQAQAGTVNLVV
jgi:hypothetical protein